MTQCFELRLAPQENGPVIIPSPSVGFFSCALRGDWIVPETVLGTLTILGRSHLLHVPAGAVGRVLSRAARGPVEYGQPLVTFDPDETAQAAQEDKRERSAPGALVFRAPSAGRIFLRPAPDAEPFVHPGTVVRHGDPVALLEVMKTFHRLNFEGDGLPLEATVREILIEDGSDVATGDAIFALGSAS